MFIRIWVDTYAYMHTCTFVYMYLQIRLYVFCHVSVMYAYTHMSIYPSIYLHVGESGFLRMCTCTGMYVYAPM